MSRAQTLFALALGAVTVLILVVGGYVLSSPRWGDRWYGRGPRGRRPGRPAWPERRGWPAWPVRRGRP